MPEAVTYDGPRFGCPPTVRARSYFPRLQYFFWLSADPVHVKINSCRRPRMRATQYPRHRWDCWVARPSRAMTGRGSTTVNRSYFTGTRASGRQSCLCGLCLAAAHRIRHRGASRSQWFWLSGRCVERSLVLRLGIDFRSDQNDDHRNPEPDHEADHGSQ